MATETVKRLVGPIALTTSAVTLYTAPAGTIGVIRHIHLANTGAVDRLVTISIGPDAANKRIWPGRKCLANDIDVVTGNIPVGPGEIIQAYADGVNVTLTIGGVEIGP